MKNLEGTDLSILIYPITIILTGLYLIANISRLFGEWNLDMGMVLYTISFTLIPISFIYLSLKRYKLKFRYSILSIIGVILIIVFLYEGIGLFLDPDITLKHILLTGQWDHTFFPLAFGFFFLCDLRKLPKKVWLMLLPFGIFCLIPNIQVAANLLLNSNLIGNEQGGGPPGLFVFFGVESLEEISKLSQEEFNHGLIEYLHEQLTFFTLFPLTIFYYYKNSNQNKKKKIKKLN